MSESEGDSNNVKGFDPGWNDPPMFTYDSRQVYNQVKKPTLTKRVGLSWDSSSPLPTSTRVDETILPASAPPRGIPHGPPPPTISVKGSSDNNVPLPHPTDPVNEEDDEPPQPSAPPLEDERTTSPSASSCQTASLANPEMSEIREINLESVLACLNELAEQLFAGKEREKAEINKRLTLLDSLWKEDKFPDDVKDKLQKISEALKTGDVDGADRLQRGLMVDHSALCCSWMAAIRKLISEKRQDTAS